MCPTSEAGKVQEEKGRSLRTLQVPTLPNFQHAWVLSSRMVSWIAGMGGFRLSGFSDLGKCWVRVVAAVAAEKNDTCKPATEVVGGKRSEKACSPCQLQVP